MFQIEYNFSNSNSVNVSKADETELRYSLFLGNLLLRKGKGSIVLDWEWIPILDFAACLLAICNKLLSKEKGKEEFEFTESDAKLFFHKDSNKVSIATSFSDEVLKMDFEEFQMAVRKFYRDMIFDIVDKNQELKNNTAFFRYLKEAEKMPRGISK